MYLNSIELLYDFKAAEYEIKQFEDEFWDAYSFIEADSESWDEVTLRHCDQLAFIFLSGKRYYYYYETGGQEDNEY